MDAAQVQQLLDQQSQQFRATLLELQQAMVQMQQQARPQGAQMPPDMEEIRAIINPKLLERCPTFSGKDEDYVEWVFTFSSVAGLLGFEEGLNTATMTDDGLLTIASMDDRNRLQAKAVWFLLVNVCRGKAHIVLKTVEKHNGFMAWKRLGAEYQPEIGDRFNAMLMSLLNPDWSKGDKPFDEQLVVWETDITEYEKQSGDQITGRFRIAVVTRHSPVELRSAVVSASAAAGDDYNKFRKQIVDTMQSGAGFTGSGLRSPSTLVTRWTSVR